MFQQCGIFLPVNFNTNSGMDPVQV